MVSLGKCIFCEASPSGQCARCSMQKSANDYVSRFNSGGSPVGNVDYTKMAGFGRGYSGSQGDKSSGQETGRQAYQTSQRESPYSLNLSYAESYNFGDKQGGGEKDGE